MPDDTRAVRESEALDWAALMAYLRDALPRQPGFAARYPPDALAGDVTVEQFGGGHSNLTYLLNVGSLRGSRGGAHGRPLGDPAGEPLGLVLRRPPLGPVPPRAHDMAREFRWLSALHPRFPLAPEPLLLCEDTSIVGSVFYVMERRRGLVIRHDEPPSVAGLPEVRRAISQSVVDTLAALHAVDIGAPALAALGKPAGFVSRQVRGWSERWSAARTADLPEMDATAAWLAAHLPPDPARPTVVHGDVKLDNVMLDATDPTRVIAVLDWEMCALGDPLVDLGILLGYWLGESDGSGAGGHDALSTVTDRPGWWDRQAIIDRYAQRSGLDVGNIGFYEAFAVFKLAVVIQQIFVRFVRGQTDDPRFAGLGHRVERLARRAAGLTVRHA